MANKTFQGRIVQKHDTSANWEKATNFIPLKGEIIIYDDLNKIKIGDGATTVVNLDFTSIPIATSNTIGGVKPITKTANMTQDVGMDSNGKLWTALDGGISGAKVGDLIKVKTVDTSGKPTAWETAVPGTDYLSESDLFICTVTASGTSYTCDKTPQQVLSAVSAGKIAIAKLNAAVYFLAAGNTQAVYFTRTDNTTVYTLLVMGTGAARLNTTSIQAANLITDLESNKTSDTTYPSSKAVWDTTPHPDAKTNKQTQPVSMDSDGKLWTEPASTTIVTWVDDGT